jgi:hypothetical protein
MTEGRLLTPTKQGRHSYYRLASPLIGRMLESIMAVAADGPLATSRAGGVAMRCEWPALATIIWQDASV